MNLFAEGWVVLLAGALGRKGTAPRGVSITKKRAWGSEKGNDGVGEEFFWKFRRKQTGGQWGAEKKEPLGHFQPTSKSTATGSVLTQYEGNEITKTRLVEGSTLDGKIRGTKDVVITQSGNNSTLEHQNGRAGLEPEIGV